MTLEDRVRNGGGRERVSYILQKEEKKKERVSYILTKEESKKNTKTDAQTYGRVQKPLPFKSVPM